jgi:hypothetical protein
MSELDRWGDSAAVALLNEVTPGETEEALTMVRARGRGQNVDQRRWSLLALAAAAIVVLVGGLVVLKNRDTDEVEPPLASPPSTAPVTNPGTATTQVPATVPPTAPATAPATAAPATSAPVTSEPTTTEPTTTPAATPDVAPLADQADFGGASKVAYAGGGVIIVSGTRSDGSPVLWEWSDGAAAWSALDLPGDNSFVPIAFVDGQVGFAFVDGYVQKTADGGSTWQRVALDSPSGGGVSVIELAIGADMVHALGVDQGGAMTFRLYTMPIAGDAFTASSVNFPPPAGGEPVTSFAFDGESGWMAVTSRTLMGAARFSGGEWSEDSNVTCVNGGVTYASSGNPGDLVRSCDSGFMGSDGSVPEATQMQVSSDAGQTFSQPLTLPTGGSPFFTLLARPAVGTIIIGGEGDSGPSITHDEGASWQPLGLPNGSFVSDLEASNSNLWVAAGSTSNGDQKVWVSRDGGATWAG